MHRSKMDDNKTEKSRELSTTADKGVIIVKRGSNGQLVLYDTERQEKISLKERDAAKLEMLMSRKETEKATKLIARLTEKNPAMIDIENNPVSIERQANLKTEQKNNEEKSEEEEEENKSKTNEEKQGNKKARITDAQITGIAAGGDFHLAMRIQDDQTGKTYDRKGLITGLDAAKLRGNDNGPEKDGIVLKNAQSIASDNFEKGMAAIIANTNGMKLN